MWPQSGLCSFVFNKQKRSRQGRDANLATGLWQLSAKARSARSTERQFKKSTSPKHVGRSSTRARPSRCVCRATCSMVSPASSLSSAAMFSPMLKEPSPTCYRTFGPCTKARLIQMQAKQSKFSLSFASFMCLHKVADLTTGDTTSHYRMIQTLTL